MAAGDPGVLKRNFSATAIQTTLVNSISSAATGDTTTSVAVVSVSGFPSTVPYTLILDPDGSKEEVVTVTAASSTTLTITRGQDNTPAVAHAAGTSVRHGVSGRDFKEEQTHIAARGYDADTAILSSAGQTHVHGLQTGDGSVVGADQVATLTRKTLTTPTINGATISGAFTSTATITGGTVTSGTITSSTVTSSTITSGTLGSNLAAGGYKITGLGTPTTTGDATTYEYVNSILGSATAASTSAASAATSASSAATSATAAATSATSAAASATAAATSATSAAASVTAAATSATSAAASATAAATSATSAAASATASASSASAAATSASSAATSASSAATSASDAATTYDNFDDRYLGSKSSAPTVDNDGNALLTGAMYWNSTSSLMFVWSGSAWVQITTTASYSAPTLGSTTINSGATVSNVNGLTINSTTIPTSKTIVTTDTTAYVATAGGSTIAVASGTTVPLTITNDGTGNSFVVNDVTSDTTPFVIDANGNTGVGTSAPKTKFHTTGLSSASLPSLGTASGSLYVTNTDVNYGLLVGVSSSTGIVWLQSQRTDATATAYDIGLQPSGGSVFIGSNVTAGQNTGGLTIQGKDIELMQIMGAY